MYLESQAEAWTLGGIAVLAGTLLGLFSLWLAKTKVHWSRRVLAIAALFTPIFAIPAPELAHVVVVQLAVVWSVVRFSSSRADRSDDASAASRRGWLRYSLRTLLVTTFVCALLLAEVHYFPKFVRERALPACVLGVISALVTLLVQRGWQQTGFRLFRWLIILLLAAACGAVLDLGAPGAILMGFTSQLGGGVQFTFHFILTSLQALLIGIIGALIWKPRAVDAHVPRRNVPSKWGYALICLIAFVLAPVYYNLVRPVQVPAVNLPKPNSLPQLVQVGKALNWRAIPNQDFESASRKQLRALMLDNARQLADARRLVRLPGGVPVNYSSSDLNHDSVQALRSLARGIAAEAKLALDTRQVPESARAGLDIVWLGQRTGEGGVFIDALVGLAIESFGAFRIRQTVGKLDRATRESLIQELLLVDRNREPFDGIANREWTWSLIAGGWRSRLSALIRSLWEEDPMGLAAANYAYLRCQAQTRLLICELALGQYAADSGAPPAQLPNLVPRYLPELPKDPHDPAGDSLRYQRQGKKWKLYSVGPDGVDNGGAIGSISNLSAGTDFALESLDMFVPQAGAAADK